MHVVKELLGTSVSISVKDAGPFVGKKVEEAFGECERIEKAFSRFIGANELAALNGALGEWVGVSEEMYELLEYGVGLCDKTWGAFDISVKSILDAWGYDKDYSFEEKKGGRLGLVELKDGKVKIASEVDLGGFGKGYAVDRVVEILDEFENFSVDAGGDIYSRGGWRTAFEHPTDVGKAIGVVEVDGFAVASSSASRRKWKDKHHLVDPVAKMPAGQMLAVYTQADKAIDADAYATALFVLGFEKAKSLMVELSLEAMLIAPEGRIFKSEGFKGELFI